VDALKDFEDDFRVARPRVPSRSAHGCWSWVVRAARTAIPLFVLDHTSSTCRSLDVRRLGSIRRPCRAFVQRLTEEDLSCCPSAFSC
jgi:hypothetical protein